MKKLLFLLIFSIFLIESATANLVSPQSSLAIDLDINTNYQTNVTVMNNNTYVIYNVTFTGLENGYSTLVTSMQPNESKIITLNFLTSSSFTKTLNSKIIYSFIGNIDQPSINYKVNITEAGYEPRNQVIRQGDSITWRNSDVITRTATHLLGSPIFDFILSPNQEQSFTFNEINDYNYYDKYIYQTGSIKVINKTSQVPIHNPANDLIFPIILSSSLIDTSLSLDLIGESFNVSYNGKSEGALKITNAGIEMAKEVRLTSDSNWIYFKTNNFTLNPNQNQFVIYEIIPIITDSTQTNKNYTIQLSVKGQNTATITKPISVFIPYQALIIPQNSTKEDALKKIAELLKIIEGLNESSNTTVTINRNQEFDVTLAKKQVDDALRSYRTISDKLEAVEKRDGEKASDINKLSQDLATLKDLYNQTSSDVATSKEKQNTISTQFFVFMMTLVLLFLFAFGIYSLNQRRKNKERMF